MMELQAPDNSKYQVRQAFIGRSTDEKPVSAEIGATLFLTDTLEDFVYSSLQGWTKSSNDKSVSSLIEIKYLLCAILSELKNMKIQLAIITDNNINHTIDQ